MKNPYHDIIHLPRPVSRTRPKMPIDTRAAQFAPYDALAGQQESIRDAERENIYRAAEIIPEENS